MTRRGGSSPFAACGQAVGTSVGVEPAGVAGRNCRAIASPVRIDIFRGTSRRTPARPPRAVPRQARELSQEPVDHGRRVIRLFELGEIPGALDRDPFEVAVRRDEPIRGRGVGEARMVPKEEERRIREPLVGAFRPGIVEQPGNERQLEERADRASAAPDRPPYQELGADGGRPWAPESN